MYNGHNIITNYTDCITRWNRCKRYQCQWRTEMLGWYQMWMLLLLFVAVVAVIVMTIAQNIATDHLVTMSIKRQIFVMELLLLAYRIYLHITYLHYVHLTYRMKNGIINWTNTVFDKTLTKRYIQFIIQINIAYCV